MLPTLRNRYLRFGSLTQGRELQQFLERRPVQPLSAWVLGHGRGSLRRNCHWSSTCLHNPISHPLERTEWYGAKEGFCSDRRRGLCPDYRKFDAVRGRSGLYQFQTPHKHLLGNPGLVPRPIGVGGPELLPSLVQIIQRRQQFTKPATRRPPLLARTCSSNYKLEPAEQKPHEDKNPFGGWGWAISWRNSLSSRVRREAFPESRALDFPQLSCSCRCRYCRISTWLGS
jgi:hypothetical protein